MANPVERIKTFWNETVQEVKKCSWPNRSELVKQTILVIVATILLTSFIWLVDSVLQFLIQEFVIGSGG